MELQGKIIQILPLQSGNKRRDGGQWQKQEIVIETEGQYPKKVHMASWKPENIASLKIGDTIKAKIEVESREYNGRWYTEVKIYGYDKISGATTTAAAQSGHVPDAPIGEKDDLPF